MSKRKKLNRKQRKALELPIKQKEKEAKRIVEILAKGKPNGKQEA